MKVRSLKKMPHLRALVCSFSAENASFSSVSRSQFFSSCAITSTLPQIDLAVGFEHAQFAQCRAAARSAAARAAFRRIQRAVRGAYQILALRIEELPRLPVEFHRDVGAAVEVGVDTAAVADGEGGDGLAAALDVEKNAVAAVGEIAAGADRLRTHLGPTFAGLAQAFAGLAHAFFASHG